MGQAKDFWARADRSLPDGQFPLGNGNQAFKEKTQDRRYFQNLI